MLRIQPKVSYQVLGHLKKVEVPTGPNIRDDTGIYTGMKITPYYDPMLAKLVA